MLAAIITENVNMIYHAGEMLVELISLKKMNSLNFTIRELRKFNIPVAKVGSKFYIPFDSVANMLSFKSNFDFCVYEVEEEVPTLADDALPWEEVPAPEVITPAPAEPETDIPPWEEAPEEEIDPLAAFGFDEVPVSEEKIPYEEFYYSYKEYADEHNGRIQEHIGWDMTPADFCATIYAQKLILSIFSEARSSDDPKAYFKAEGQKAYACTGNTTMQAVIATDFFALCKGRELPLTNMVELLVGNYWVSNFLDQDGNLIEKPKTKVETSADEEVFEGFKPLEEKAETKPEPKKEAPAAAPAAAPAEAPKAETVPVKFNSYILANTIKGNTWCSSKIDFALENGFVAKCYSIQHAICVLEAQHSAGPEFAAMMADSRGFSSYMGKGPWDGQACSKCITKMHKEYKSGEGWEPREQEYTRKAAIAAYTDPRNQEMVKMLLATKGKAIMASSKLPNGKKKISSTAYTRLLQEIRDTILK